MPDTNTLTPMFTRRAPTALMVGEFASVAPFRHFAGAFREAGWDVVEIETQAYLSSPGGRMANRVIDRLFPRVKMESLGAAVTAEALRLKPDLVLFAKGFGASIPVLSKLAEYGIRTANWYPDFHFDHPFVDREALARFDLMVTTKAFQLDYLQSLRGSRPTILIEHGYCDGIHLPVDPPIDDADKPFDLVFVGNHSSYKAEWLAHISAQMPELSMAVVGSSGWAGERHRMIAHTYINGPLAGQQMARAFAHGRIAFAVHHGPGGTDGWQDDVSARTFEIPACRAFMLHIDSPHLRTLYDVPTEIDVFATPDEAVEKIRYYLPRPELRETMASLAYARAIPAYGYRAVGRNIADHCARLLAAGANGSHAA